MKVTPYVVVHGDCAATECTTEQAAIQRANKILSDSCSCDGDTDVIGVYRLVAKVKRPKVNADVEYVRK